LYSRGQFDAHPGGHAKWVRSPHGPATVSGNAALRFRGPVCQVHEPVTELRLGKTRAAGYLIRESGNLVPGASFLRRARRREEPMRMSRLWRLAPARAHRLVPFNMTVLLLSAIGASASEHQLSGTVVHQSGVPLPRAYVQIVDAPAARSAGVLTDESGRFRLSADATDCRVEASLSGFATAAVACTADPLRIVL